MPVATQEMDYVRGGTQQDIYTAEQTVEVPCPLCGSREHRRLYTEHGVIGICQCSKCSLIYTSPRVTMPEEVYWGKEEIYYEEARLIFEGKAAHHRDPNYTEELDLIQQFKPRGRVLDVGCHMGMLLRLARKRAWDVCGVDPTPALSNLAIKKFGLPVYQCFVNELPEEVAHSFDVVALSDVFEHISEPLSFLEDVKRVMKPDGILYVKVPNALWNVFKQQQLERRGRRPQSGLWDSYEHVVHYTDASLKAMLEKAGLRVKQCTIGKPVQIPVWHNYVGHYYQYPTPFALDWKRYLGRSLCYYGSRVEKVLRGGSIGALAPNIAELKR